MGHFECDRRVWLLYICLGYPEFLELDAGKYFRIASFSFGTSLETESAADYRYGIGIEQGDHLNKVIDGVF